MTGAKESGLLHEMMDGYALSLGSLGIHVRTIDASGEGHFSVLSRLGDPESTLHKLALELVRGRGRTFI
jgi:hypothetical protein